MPLIYRRAKVDSFVIHIVLLSLVVIVGSICGFVALVKIGNLKHEIKALTGKVEFLLQKSNQTYTPMPKVQDVTIKTKESTTTDVVNNVETPTNINVDNAKSLHENSVERNTKTALKNQENTNPQPDENQFFQQFKNNWMIWIGGVALAFGGVFFVNYSLDAGLLSPMMRVLLGTLFGLSLIVAAEYLHRKKVPFEGFANYVPAVLAGGGFISLFALTLLTLISFKLIEPIAAFVLLAIIALGASWYALRFGPVLALLGILGSYSVPLWISSEQPQWILLLCYVAFISVSATLVANKVKRSWLWYMIWIAHLGWLLLSLVSINNSYSEYIAWSVFSAVSVWLLIIWPRLGLRPRVLFQEPLGVLPLIKQIPDNPLLFVIFSGTALAIGLQTDLMTATCILAIFALILFIAPLGFSGWDAWPLLILPLLGVFLFSQTMPSQGYNNFLAFQGLLGIALVFTFLIFIYTLFLASKYPKRLSFSILASSIVFWVLGLSYANNSADTIDILYPFWFLILLGSSAILIVFAQRSSNLLQSFCYWAGANANLTFSFTLVLDKTALTLAISLQVLLVSWLIRRLRLTIPQWLIKLLIAGVLLRLTITPWMDDYTDLSLFSLHWTTLFYPIVMIVFALSLLLWQTNKTMQSMLLGALLHLIALYVTTQTGLYLVGHIPNFFHLSLYEHILLSMNWLLLGSVYLYRQQLAGQLAQLYRIGAAILLGVGMLLQLRLLTQYNPFIEDVIYIGSSVIFSWLWLWWGVPLLVSLWVYKKSKLLTEQIKQPALISASVFFTLLINGLIRQFWQGENIFIGHLTSEAELYSYSIIWLMLSASLVAISHLKQQEKRQKIGVALLALVIAKVFLIDMANLEGLLRAVSFIGLGLCLVALSWLFQWLRKQNQTG